MEDRALLEAIGTMLDEKLDRKLDEKLDQKLGQKLDEKLNPIILRLDGLEASLARMEKRQDRMEERQDRMEASLARMEERQDRMEASLVRMEKRQDRMEERQDRMEASLQKIALKLENEIEPKLTSLFDGYYLSDERISRMEKLQRTVEDISIKVDILIPAFCRLNEEVMNHEARIEGLEKKADRSA